MISPLQGDEMKHCSIPARIIKVITYSVAVLIFMVIINMALKVTIPYMALKVTIPYMALKVTIPYMALKITIPYMALKVTLPRVRKDTN